MKQKGFTVVELMTTFVLISIIGTLLIQLTITLKEIYINGDMKTTLLTKQSTITDKIESDLNNNKLISLTSCGETCIDFTYLSGVKQLKIDKTKKVLSYDNYAIKLGDSNNFSNISVTKENYTIGNIINIKASITNKLVKGDYGINIIYQADSSVTFDDTITNTFK